MAEKACLEKLDLFANRLGPKNNIKFSKESEFLKVRNREDMQRPSRNLKILANRFSL